MSDGSSEEARWFVVDGRRWRRSDPTLPSEVEERLLHHLGRGRSGVRTAKRAGDEEALAAARHRVRVAKVGLGERGDPWWEQDPDVRERRWTDALAGLDGLDGLDGRE
ncbi:hypothetical protein [Nocardioides marmoribigeumensis]|uniref:Biopolymer transporter Tol n=1 Tax=Nocardioides marmoribigeumensis TaxID=433649 RepID=A0ABU2BYL1_9ACTN|nr:hypothetical protein [Nocardioides marmoribigeumensis]MDR7363493.1 hypothetical protein [Nocardioides marmoribigeumensis]